ncbi:hypothetical protein PhaeoP97_02308 [Phaeobacter porticola]|uniref:DUF4760 domain-containing protein n=2 Tax=Phaeobacter porticola TaxID=1844006 RepID=A0A1L3I6Q6_9RHOB|nr:hypothetical protein PhaeoP97_02308 [Phaeobacter porticola]
MSLLGSSFDENIVRYGTYGLSILVALFASAVALAGVFANIDSQATRFSIERSATQKAAKALLPIALSRFDEVCEKAVDIALSDDTVFADPKNAVEVREALEIGDETVRILKECIEYSDEVTQEWLTIIFARYQVASSRLLGSVADPSRVITNHTRGSHAYDWEVIRAILNHLFSFARGQEDAPSDKIDLETIAISSLHPMLGTSRCNAAQERIRHFRARLNDGNLEDFRSLN